MNRTENEEKSMNKCLQLLIKELRHLQHDLESTLRIDDFIHNKLINACQKISACQYACFKSSEILTKLINDLKSSITTYQ
jgi:succinate dehydrogenase/fumarate reductase-like Fe-S protein